MCTWCERQAELLEGAVHPWEVMRGEGLQSAEGGLRPFLRSF